MISYFNSPALLYRAVVEVDIRALIETMVAWLHFFARIEVVNITEPIELLATASSAG